MLCVQETIKPSKYFVTRWQSDPYASMSYSYVPVGCTADAYDDMAEPVNNKIFFAGEVNCLCFLWSFLSYSLDYDFLVSYL